MILEFLPDAVGEMYSATQDYESKEAGLGWRFRGERVVVAAIAYRNRFPGYGQERE
jgi:hypothetical protein